MSPEPPEEPPPGPRETLAKMIRHQAMLREKEADLTPGNEDDVQVAEGLRDFALWIEQQVGSDARFGTFALLGGVLEVHTLNALNEALSRYEFGNPGSESTCDYIFDSLIDDLMLEASGRLTYGGDLEAALETVRDWNTFEGMGVHVYLRHWLEAFEAELVLRARMDGLSWGQIGKGLRLPWRMVQDRYEANEI